MLYGNKVGTWNTASSSTNLVGATDGDGGALSLLTQGYIGLVGVRANPNPNSNPNPKSGSHPSPSPSPNPHPNPHPHPNPNQARRTFEVRVVRTNPRVRFEAFAHSWSPPVGEHIDSLWQPVWMVSEP